MPDRSDATCSAQKPDAPEEHIDVRCHVPMMSPPQAVKAGQALASVLASASGRKSEARSGARPPSVPAAPAAPPVPEVAEPPVPRAEPPPPVATAEPPLPLESPLFAASTE